MRLLSRKLKAGRSRYGRLLGRLRSISEHDLSITDWEMASTRNASVNTGSFADVYAEGLRYFMGEGNLNQTLAQLTADLKEHGIDYMVIGAVALLAHGYKRFTSDIDLVLTPEGLDSFHR